MSHLYRWLIFADKERQKLEKYINVSTYPNRDGLKILFNENLIWFNGKAVYAKYISVCSPKNINPFTPSTNNYFKVEIGYLRCFCVENKITHVLINTISQKNFRSISNLYILDDILKPVQN